MKKLLKLFNIIFFKLFCFFVPIKKNKIVFSCYGGNGEFGCNPKYILLELLSQKLPYEIVWIGERKLDSVETISNRILLKKMYALASARMWIDNSFKTKDYQNGLCKKKNQIYINTWHGSFGIKKMYYDMKDFNPSPFWEYFFKKEVVDIDYMLASSSWEENIYRSGINFKGKTLKVGNPRNDLFFKDYYEIKKKVCKFYNLELDTKILLYAPSFREKFDKNKYELDYSNLKAKFEDKFGGDWIIFSRFHINEHKYLNQFKFNSYIDVSKYPDMQELLVSSDVLISDYSSCMFDFMLLKRPCFVYANDIDEFEAQRGLHYSLDETPFKIAKNNDELMKNIQEFNKEEYMENCKEFIKQKEVVFDGLASKKVVEFIKKNI